MNEKLSFKEKILIYYSYNKYKLPIVFSFIGLYLLTGFPWLHYKYWYEKVSKWNAVSVFIIMILSLVQFINSINLSNKTDKKKELVNTVLFTVINIAMMFFAYLYISPYLLQGYQNKYFISIFVISLGILFYLIANVFAFIFLGYDPKVSLQKVIEELSSEE